MSASSLLGSALAAAARTAAAPLGRRRGAKALGHLADLAAPVLRVKTPLGPLAFRCPNMEAVRVPARLTDWEPETCAWIETEISPDDCLWDIGAHIGAFALYAALKVRGGKGRVAAFEPSADSYAALNDNIRLSGLADKVDAYCLALSDKSGAGLFHLRATGAAGSQHAYGDPVSFDGRFAPAFSQATLSLTIDDAVERFGIAPPDHVKLDVDSIEEAILRGGARTLGRVRSLMIEWEAVRPESWVAAVRGLLGAAGLHEAPLGAGRNKLFRRA